MARSPHDPHPAIDHAVAKGAAAATEAARARASLRLAGPDLGATKAKILEAAFRRLVAEGYVALSLREIAKDAGVNHALINYHFGSKDRLVVEVLDAANRRLLARQSAMYTAPETSGRKWAQAVRFYEADLASGFVRMQLELLTASLSHPALRAQLAPRVMAWRQLIEQAVREAMQAFEAGGGQLPPYITPQVVSTWIGHFWLGLELVDLIDSPGERARGRRALAAMQRLIDALDARAGRRAEPPQGQRRRADRENAHEPAAVPAKLPKDRRRPARARVAAR